MSLFRIKTIKYFVGLIIFSGSLILNLTSAQASYSAGDLVDLTNSARAEIGLGALSTNSNLTSAAYAKALDILDKDYFAHNSPDGKTPWDFINESGYNYLYAGENLAIGYSDASELFTAWMNSPTHRDNIVNPNYREIGIAVVSGDYEGAQTIVAVQEFGASGGAVEQVASENTTLASPTPNSSVSPTATQNQEKFTYVLNKTSFNPDNIFAGEEVEFKVTVTGEIKTLTAKAFDKSFNLLESSTVTGSDTEKTYTLKQKIDQAGSSEVEIYGIDKNGNSDTLKLGTLEVREKVLTKGETQEKTGFLTGFISHWPIFVFALAILALALTVYSISKKNRFYALMTSWRF